MVWHQTLKQFIVEYDLYRILKLCLVQYGIANIIKVMYSAVWYSTEYQVTF